MIDPKEKIEVGDTLIEKVNNENDLHQEFFYTVLHIDEKDGFMTIESNKTKEKFLCSMDSLNASRNEYSIDHSNPKKSTTTQKRHGTNLA
jgi:hypothetical protein